MKNPQKVKAARSPSSGCPFRHDAGPGAREQLNQTVAALDDTGERLRAILETAVEGIITIDEFGIIESMNPAAERTFGYRLSEVVGKNVSMLMPPPYSAQHDAYMTNYRKTGRARIIGIGREVSALRKDGTVFPIDLSVSEVRLANRRMFTGFVRDITERKRLEKEILETSDREQRRIGQDLHDGLCQQLAGIELLSQVLQQNLEAKSIPESKRVGEIAALVRDAISHTRLLARGLSPVTLESEGLMSALHELALSTRKIFNIDCVFRCDRPVLLDDQMAANQLFRIAQEAVSNAIRHGKASRIVIQLKQSRGRLVVSILDDGAGFPKNIPMQKGMGLRIMQSRAGLIGGSVVFDRSPLGGAKVICSVAEIKSVDSTKSNRARKKQASRKKADSHR